MSGIDDNNLFASAPLPEQSSGMVEAISSYASTFMQPEQHIQFSTSGAMSGILPVVYQHPPASRSTRTCVACRKAKCQHTWRCPGSGNRALCSCVKSNKHPGV